MDKQIQWWFPGFEAGLAALTEQQRDAFFRPCAEHCVRRGALNSYQNIFQKAGGSLDPFFSALDTAEGVGAEILVPGQEYLLYFYQCSCALCTADYVHTPLLCACSRQSILYTLETLWPEEQFTVEEEETILGGAAECRFHIVRQ